jgi:hypothetical protein
MGMDAVFHCMPGLCLNAFRFPELLLGALHGIDPPQEDVS